MLVLCPPWDTVSPPLGLAYLSAYLEHKGFRVDVMDLNIELYHRISTQLRDKLWGFTGFLCWEQEGIRLMEADVERYLTHCVESMLSANAPVIGFSLYHANVALSIEIARRIKKATKAVKIIFGGPGCSDPFDREGISSAICEFMVVGEGEIALAEMLTRLKKGHPVGDIDGVYDSQFDQNFDYRAHIADLGETIFPTYHGFSLEKYTGNGLLRILGSRGCIGRCKFCNENYYSEKYRSISSEHIFAEIRFHVERNRIYGFKFSDQLINGDLPALDRLCDLIISAGYPIRWEGQAILRRGMTSELLAKMQQAGCYRLDFGLETGSASIAKRMAKPFSLSQAETVIANSKGAAICTCINIIVGFPGESETEFLATLEFLERNRKSIDMVANLSTCFIKPFCDIYFKPQKYGVAMPRDPYFWYRWQDLGVSANRHNRQRVAKLKRVAEHCRELGILVENTFFFTNESECRKQ